MKKGLTQHEHCYPSTLHTKILPDVLSQVWDSRLPSLQGANVKWFFSPLPSCSGAFLLPSQAHTLLLRVQPPLSSSSFCLPAQTHLTLGQDCTCGLAGRPLACSNMPAFPGRQCEMPKRTIWFGVRASEPTDNGGSERPRSVAELARLQTSLSA